jgi:citrate/tricarballylate utilization protein
MPAPEVLDEARRVMTICNACRYCEGHCAVFPAMAMRLEFAAGDLNYLANLCHDCGACFHHCQYAPPHEFAVDVPRVFAEVRRQTWRDYAWPRFLAGAFERAGLAAGLVTAASLALVVLLTCLLVDPDTLLARHAGAGAFYAVIPHQVMVVGFGAVSIFMLLALAMGLRGFWRDVEQGKAPLADRAAVGDALRDALTLRNLDGGSGDGCTYPSERPSHARRRFHHLTFYGFLLCFASTSTATVYHYLLGWQAPYPFLSLPVALGTLGGIGLLVGPAGLLWLKRRADPEPFAYPQRGMDTAFLVLLLLSSLTGLLLLLLRTTPAMGVLLAVHLGVILALFLTLPYGKFVHAIYRLAALVRYATERRRSPQVGLAEG